MRQQTTSKRKPAFEDNKDVIILFTFSQPISLPSKIITLKSFPDTIELITRLNSD